MAKVVREWADLLPAEIETHVAQYPGREDRLAEAPARSMADLADALTPEVEKRLGVVWLTPATFVSSGFVPASTLPAPLRIVAEWNPATAAINAARKLFGNQAPGGSELVSTGWPATHSTYYAPLCSLAIMAVFVPLSIRAYRRAATS
ncbi:hypothetical protein [Frankia sp. AiPa1]|uniref:hypothetical protein n=1 Tax=Frankia sp. AiPa1 TaxID=573492 RepID=UPI00202AE8F6|nr:hypothetical protein [Frankia sp. AiPa1]